MVKNMLTFQRFERFVFNNVNAPIIRTLPTVDQGTRRDVKQLLLQCCDTRLEQFYKSPRV